jgi:hypothetical protein
MSGVHIFNAPIADLAVLPGRKAVVQMAKSSSSGKAPTDPGTKPVMPLVKNWGPDIFLGNIIWWGNNNDFPQQVIDDYNKDPLIPQSLDILASKLIGNGVMAVNVTDVDADGNDIFTYIKDKDIRAFVENRAFKRFMLECATDMTWFFNVFPEMVLSRDRSQILYMEHQEAAHCRWSIQNQKTGKSDKVYISANWPQVSDGDETVSERLAIDPYRYDAIDWVRNGSQFSYIYPMNYPTPGKMFYQLAHHNSIRESGWLDVRRAIPQFKKFLMKNQMDILWVWKIDPRYWPMLFGQDVWEKLKPLEQQAKQLEWLQKMNESLTGEEKAGSAVIFPKVWDPEAGGNGMYMEYIEVTRMTEAMKDGKYIDDNLEAAANIFYALGLDPTIVGFAGGKNMGAHSGGSDKREAWLMHLARMRPYRDMLLEPLDFVAEYNGWKERYPGLTFKFRDTILTTLDTGAGTKPVAA